MFYLIFILLFCRTKSEKYGYKLQQKLMECVLRSVMSEGNVAQGKAIKSICKSPKPLFITGKGGTGKTYFLKRVIPALKNAVVVAPTGIAAVNAGGQTIHSFSESVCNLTFQR